MADDEDPGDGPIPAPSLLGLGQHVDPDMPAKPNDQKNSWQSYLSDPVNRSMLLGAGLQMMTGGWGNGSQQLAAAIGAGAQSGAGTASAIQQQQQKDTELAQAKEIAGEHNKTTLEAARIAGSSREQQAEIRGRFSVERANIALQKAPASVAIKYMDQARKIVQGNIGNMSMDDRTMTALIQDKAASLYQADADRGLVPQTHDATDSAGGSPKTTGAGTTGAADTTAKSQQQNPQTALQKALADKTFGSQVQQDLTTQAGRNKLRATNSALGPELDAYEAKIKSAPHNLIRGLLGAPPTEN